MPARELKPQELRWRCPEIAKCRTSADIAPAAGTVGQDRALEALRLGLELRSPGYNVFVAGLAGTGRATTVRELVAAAAPGQCPVLRDRAYVHGFHDADRPKLLEFPAGQAARFADDMDRLVSRLKRDIPKLLEDEAIKQELSGIEEAHRTRLAKLTSSFDEKLKKHGFAMTKLRLREIEIPEIAPVIQGKPVPMPMIDELEQQGAISSRDAGALRERYEALRAELDGILKQMPEILKGLHDKVAEIERRVVGRFAHLLTADLKARYPSAAAYLDEVGASIVEDTGHFRVDGSAAPAPGMPALLSQLGSGGAEDPMLKYRVNVIQDSSARKECPIVFEDVPTQANLIGTVEVQALPGRAARTNFTQIRAGALLRADGGFLILDLLEVLFAPGAWQAIKRVLKTGKLEIAIPESPLMPSGLAMKPEPIDVDVKVVLLGDPQHYDLLWTLDEDFRGIFKIKAHFDSEMKLSEKTLQHFVAAVSRIVQKEKLPPIEQEGLKAIVEESVRRTGRQSRITARFSDVADVVRESTYWARKEGAGAIGAAHVRHALQAHDARHQLLEEKIQELIDDGIINIEVAGARVGQVNGLSVYDLGMYSFGRPSRITASVSMGKTGVLSVEREVGLSGRIHDKGVLILAGLIRERYAQDFPLSLSASVTFEQSYSGVEGDSASSTEVYALLSALAAVPIRQAIAVTGSVDQKGNVQAIGGVNQKIEGFYAVCKAKGLTGEQGVMIPHTNANDLMLKDEVIEAVSKGRFHIWSVETIDQGIELLTGVPAGPRDERGAFPSGSINARVESRLRDFAEKMARFERSIQ